MLVLPGSEVDHVPTVSGRMGQLPVALPVVENCTRLAGDDEWSPIALAGVMLAVMTQLLLEVPPHPVERTLREITAENNTEVFMRTYCLIQLILYRSKRLPRAWLSFSPLSSRESDRCRRMRRYSQSVSLQRGLCFPRPEELPPGASSLL